ncbi:hypothetical protein ACFL5Z_13240 [Planctomycetota bacterium]
MSRCSWCGQSIPEDTPVFGFGGKTRPGVDIAEFEGGAIRISLVTQDRTVTAIVPTAGSQARLEGHDFMFMVCSETCGSEMKAVLDAEIAFGDGLFEDIGRIQNN